MPTLYFEQREKLRAQIRQNIKKAPSEAQLDEVLEALLRIGTEVDEALLSTAGKVIFNSHSALASVDAEALNANLPALRESRKRALEVWRPEWFRRVNGQTRDWAG